MLSGCHQLRTYYRPVKESNKKKRRAHPPKVRMASSVIHDDTAIGVTANRPSQVDRNPRGVQRHNRDPIDNGRLKPNFHGKKGRPNHNGDEKYDGRQYPK